MKWPWLLALLSAVLGLALVILARVGWIENPNLYLSGLCEAARPLSLPPR